MPHNTSIEHDPRELKFFNEIQSEFQEARKNIYAGRLLERAYKLFPDQLALVDQKSEVSYKQLFYWSLILSKKLRQQGIKPRDKIILYAQNSIMFYVAYFAAWQCGAVIVPVNTFLHERELSYIIKDCAPSLIIASSNLKPQLNKLTETRMLETLPPCMTEENIAFDQASDKQMTNEAERATIDDLEYDELCTLLYTSGTTGNPKGVMLSSKNIIANTMQAAARFRSCGLSSTERFICILPLFHVFAQNACLWLPVMTGSSVVIVSKIDRKLIVKGLEKKPTVFFGFPALYGLLCLMKTAPLHSVKMFVSGADMLPDKIRAGFALIYGRKICAGYGLSEAAPVVAVNERNETMPTRTVGKPVIGLACEVRDENGALCDPGQIGTLYIKGDNIMMGYYNADEATQKVLCDGWLNTGDLASLDKHGNLTITGRQKDVIIHKGFNIYPAEVENILMSHQAVFKAAVIGHHDEATGQVPVAYVAVKDKGENLEKILRTLCSDNLASYKIPRKFVCLDDLPMNATGKVDKKQLTK